MHPILAKMERPTRIRSSFVLKNEELAIPKDQIDRIDYRPLKTGGRSPRKHESTVETADAKTAAESPNNVPGETTSSSTN